MVDPVSLAVLGSIGLVGLIGGIYKYCENVNEEPLHVELRNFIR
jgi:hypothetical protein